jgi:pilus assembly protein CpaB
MLAPLEFLALTRRRVLIRRRPIAAVCAALAVWTALHQLTESPPAGIRVVTAAHDLDSGDSLRPEDLRVTSYAPGSVPERAVRDPRALIGRTLLVPLTTGEALTARQVLGPSALAGYPDRSAVALRIPDQDAAALLDSGDRVDLVASDPQGDDKAETLVADAVVLALPKPDPEAARIGVESGGRLVLFAVPTEDVEHVAAVASSHFLTVIWNR